MPEAPGLSGNEAMTFFPLLLAFRPAYHAHPHMSYASFCRPCTCTVSLQ